MAARAGGGSAGAIRFAPAYAGSQRRRDGTSESVGLLPFQFFLVAALLLAFRFWLAAVTPITGDEAYFIYWGKIPDWGFYDHPPMVGWWLAALLAVGDSPWWLRLPMVIQPVILAFAAVRFLQPRGERLAWSAGLLLLLAPVSVWGITITTDTPLIYFCFFSALAFIRAARDDDSRYYLLAGVLLTGAFLSKYFSVLLALSYAVYAVYRPTRGKLLGLALVAAASLPGPLLNIWWNTGHCWANIMFNVYNRHEGAGLSWKTPLLYAVMMAYLLTPFAVARLWRGRGQVAGLAALPENRAMLVIAFVPLALFALLSFVKTIGLHWVLSFLPFALMAAALAADEAKMLTLKRGFAGLALLHVLIIGVIAFLPVETWRNLRMYDGIVMTVKPQELLERLAPFRRDYVLAAEGYSPAVTMSYNAGQYFFVFGEGSSHARHDDILTDLRKLDGGNVLVLRKSAADPGQYDPYFAEVEYREFEVRGARFFMVLGRDFNFARYRDQVLTKVRDRYYAIPRWLPQTGCYFCERYFAGSGCGR